MTDRWHVSATCHRTASHCNASNGVEASVREEIEHVTDRGASRSIQFGVAALRTGDGRKPFILYIKHLGQETSGGSHLIRLELVVTAFWTLPFVVLHQLFSNKNVALSGVITGMT